jgi:hypothetical protein
MEFIDHGRGIQFTGSGNLTGEEMIASKHKLLADESKVRPLRFAVVSLVDVGHFDITPTEVHVLAGSTNRSASSRRWSPSW